MKLVIAKKTMAVIYSGPFRDQEQRRRKRDYIYIYI